MNTTQRNCEALDAFLSYKLDHSYPTIAEDRGFTGGIPHGSTRGWRPEKSEGRVQKWRTEYCAGVCSHRASCMIAPKFAE